MPIPITVFTGFLGAGKTTVILSLLSSLPKDCKVVLLKNEFGDVQVDSKLAQQSSLTAVSEILNGCMCCVLVGQMQSALIEIRDNYKPDRIIIECSGSAFPATLAFQIRQLERDTNGDFSLDAIVTVIDAENFVGYEDTSPTAKMQASYSDLILINKWEHVSERELDVVMDHLHTLNDTTPKVKCRGREGVDPALIFGLETSLFSHSDGQQHEFGAVHDEVETVTISTYPQVCSKHGHTHAQQGVAEPAKERALVKKEDLVTALNAVSKEGVWRIKGFVRLEEGWVLLNWAFGRFEIHDYDGNGVEGSVLLTAMGARGEVKMGVRQFAKVVEAVLSQQH